MRRGGSGSSASAWPTSLSFEAAHAHAFDDAAVGDQENDQERQGAQRGARHDGAVGLGAVGAAKQAERKAKIASAPSTGWDSGKTMRVKMRHGPAPSMRAASSSSAGSVRKNWRSRKTPNAKV